MADDPDNILLLAGFEPFGEFTVNPSEQIARALDGETIGKFKVQGLVLPVVFGAAADRLLEAVEHTRPAAVVCLGLAAERRDITLERLAVNLDDARIPDNAGNRPVDEVILPGGPPACWSTLPVRAMLDALGKEGIPASLSMSAGTFVCNHVFYRLMHALDGMPSIPGGFIHLPQVREQADDGEAISLATLLAATRRLVETLSG